MEVDEQTELSPSEKNANYLMLMHAIKDTEGRTDMPIQWKDEHKAWLLKCRSWFPDFNCIMVIEEDPDIVEQLEENRRRCEVLMRNLETSIKKIDKFDVVVYRLFAQNLEPLVKQHMDKPDIDKIMSQFKKMGL